MERIAETETETDTGAEKETESGAGAEVRAKAIGLARKNAMVGVETTWTLAWAGAETGALPRTETIGVFVLTRRTDWPFQIC